MTGNYYNLHNQYNPEGDLLHHFQERLQETYPEFIKNNPIIGKGKLAGYVGSILEYSHSRVRQERPHHQEDILKIANSLLSEILKELDKIFQDKDKISTAFDLKLTYDPIKFFLDHYLQRKNDWPE